MTGSKYNITLFSHMIPLPKQHLRPHFHNIMLHKRIFFQFPHVLNVLFGFSPIVIMGISVMLFTLELILFLITSVLKHGHNVFSWIFELLQLLDSLIGSFESSAHGPDKWKKLVSFLQQRFVFLFYN